MRYAAEIRAWTSANLRAQHAYRRRRRIEERICVACGLMTSGRNALCSSCRGRRACAKKKEKP